ncbi:MAG: DUF5719 family protein, partial [Streptosporangiaceae bacterium]
PARPAAVTGPVVPVNAAVLACPAPVNARVGALAGPAGGGQAVVADLKSGRALATLGTPGVTWSATPAARTVGGAVVIRAGGGLAGGFAAEQTTRTRKYLAGVRCAEPQIDHWFLGPGPGAATVDLLVTNVDDVAASVDVTALSNDGSLDTTDGRGLEVAPRSTRTIKVGRSADGLGVLAAQSETVALHVSVTTGRVAAAVREDLGGKGVDWVPVTTAPATRVVLPGIPGGNGSRTLMVGVPGETDAHVKVQVITASGAFAPEGQDTIEAPATTVSTADLEGGLSGKAGAVLLTSDQPIVAGFVATGDDVSFGAATLPLTGGGGSADARDGSSLVLTAPQAAARVRVTPVTAQGAGTPADVEVGAGRTLEVPQSQDGVLIQPLPGSGPVHAARVMLAKAGDDRLVTVLPIVSSPGTVRLPPVLDSLGFLLP